MFQLEDPTLYHVTVHHDEKGSWIALYDAQRGQSQNRTALEAELLMPSESTSPEEVQRIMLDQFGLVPLDAWELVTTRYGHGWQAPFGSALRTVAA